MTALPFTHNLQTHTMPCFTQNHIQLEDFISIHFPMHSTSHYSNPIDGETITVIEPSFLLQHIRCCHGTSAFSTIHCRTPLYNLYATCIPIVLPVSCSTLQKPLHLNLKKKQYYTSDQSLMGPCRL